MIDPNQTRKWLKEEEELIFNTEEDVGEALAKYYQLRYSKKYSKRDKLTMDEALMRIKIILSLRK